MQAVDSTWVHSDWSCVLYVLEPSPSETIFSYSALSDAWLHKTIRVGPWFKQLTDVKNPIFPSIFLVLRVFSELGWTLPEVFTIGKAHGQQVAYGVTEEEGGGRSKKIFFNKLLNFEMCHGFWVTRILHFPDFEFQDFEFSGFWVITSKTSFYPDFELINKTLKTCTHTENQSMPENQIYQ